MNEQWPVAALDPLRRLRVLAAARPGTAFAETVIAAPYEQVWATAADLEVELPRMIRDFRSVHATAVDGERLVLSVRGHLGQRARFDVVLRPGWCWMQSRLWAGGMAAVPDAGATLVGFLGGLRLPGLAAVDAIVGPAARRLARGALGRLARDVEDAAGPQ